jgi:Tfp pilus assembly protein PilN
MIRINLYPEQRRSQLQARSDLLKQGVVVIGAIVGAVIACAIIASVKGNEFKVVEEEKAQKTVRLEELKKEIGVVDNLENEKAALDAKRQGIIQLRETQEGPVLIMDHISRSMTEAKVWLTSLSVNGKSVRLSGMALTNEDIVDFQTTLQSKPSFSKVNLIVSQKEGGSADQPLYRFELSLDG